MFFVYTTHHALLWEREHQQESLATRQTKLESCPSLATPKKRAAQRAILEAFRISTERIQILNIQGFIVIWMLGFGGFNEEIMVEWIKL